MKGSTTMTTQDTPFCPDCEAPMVLRKSAKGFQFYGCTRFPKCKGYRPFKFTAQEVVKVAPPTNVVGSAEQVSIWDFIKTGITHLIVEAVAGSGKTFTIVHALTMLLSTLRIVFLAFNKHIADELASRVPAGTVATTLHSLAYAQVRRFFPKIKLDQYKLNTIIESLVPKGDEDTEPHNIFIRASVKRLVQLVKYNLIELSNRAIDNEATLDELSDHYDVELNDSRSEIYTLVATALRMSIKDTKSLDFDDMLYFVYAHNIPVENFDVVIGDELQDWNAMQQHFAMKLLGNNGRFIGVGDRYQSIYGFAGADINSIPNMIDRLQNTQRGITTLPLNQTRRCPVSHVNIAKQFVAHLEALDTAQIGTVQEMTTDQAITAMNCGDMGISRRNAPLVSIAYRLLRNGKAVSIKGKDIGEGLIKLVGKLNSKSIAQLIDKAEKYREREAEKLLAQGRKGENRLAALNDKIDTLIALTEDVDTIKELVAKIDTIFTDDLTNRIVLSSVHKAKGLEADVVYILDHDKLMLPMKQEWTVQQERNLAYVAYTRGKDTLVLVSDPK